MQENFCIMSHNKGTKIKWIKVHFKNNFRWYDKTSQQNIFTMQLCEQQFTKFMFWIIKWIKVWKYWKNVLVTRSFIKKSNTENNMKTDYNDTEGNMKIIRYISLYRSLFLLRYWYFHGIIKKISICQIFHWSRVHKITIS